MIELPVRIDLRVKPPDKAVCSFTILYQFVLPPSQGDHIIFGNGLYSTVSQCFHYGGGEGFDPSLLVITQPHIFLTYDEFLRNLDWFKSIHNIQDIAAKEKPAPYYSFYRSLLRLMGISHADPKLSYEDHNIRLFCECCRVILIAECYQATVSGEGEAGRGATARCFNVTKVGVDRFFSQYNQSILQLTRIVLGRKTDDPDETDILNLIKEWEPLINPSESHEWSADLETCQQVGRIVFSRIRSIPSAVLPRSLRND